MESTNLRASHARLTFRPQRFSRSRRFPPPHTVASLFHLTAAFGIAPQGFPPLPSRLASSTSRPLMSLPSFSSWRVAPPVQFDPLRLQGFVPSSGPLRPVGGLDLPSARSPRVFSLLRAYLRMPWRRLHAPSAHDLSRLALVVYATTSLQRINQHST